MSQKTGLDPSTWVNSRVSRGINGRKQLFIYWLSAPSISYCAPVEGCLCQPEQVGLHPPKTHHQDCFFVFVGLQNSFVFSTMVVIVIRLSSASASKCEYKSKIRLYPLPFLNCILENKFEEPNRSLFSSVGLNIECKCTPE